MSVELIMTRQVVTIDLDADLKEIGDYFQKHRFHHIPVLEKKKLVGILSDRDYLRAVSPYVGSISENKETQQSLYQKAHQIMSRNPVTIKPETTIENAASLLLEKGIACLPVLAEDMTLEGVLTWKDILRFYLRKMWCENPLVDFD